MVVLLLVVVIVARRVYSVLAYFVRRDYTPRGLTLLLASFLGSYNTT